MPRVPGIVQVGGFRRSRGHTMALAADPVDGLRRVTPRILRRRSRRIARVFRRRPMTRLAAHPQLVRHEFIARGQGQRACRMAGETSHDPCRRLERRIRRIFARRMTRRSREPVSLAIPALSQFQVRCGIALPDKGDGLRARSKRPFTGLRVFRLRQRPRMCRPRLRCILRRVAALASLGSGVLVRGREALRQPHSTACEDAPRAQPD